MITISSYRVRSFTTKCAVVSYSILRHFSSRLPGISRIVCLHLCILFTVTYWLLSFTYFSCTLHRFFIKLREKLWVRKEVIQSVFALIFSIPTKDARNAICVRHTSLVFTCLNAPCEGTWWILSCTKKASHKKCLQLNFASASAKCMHLDYRIQVIIILYNAHYVCLYVGSIMESYLFEEQLVLLFPLLW